MIENAPPWEAEQVRQAQAFIDREWARHVHDTEHVADPEWRMPPALSRALWGTRRRGRCWCRDCTTDAWQQDERDLMHVCRHCYYESTQVPADPGALEQLTATAAAAIADPSSPWAIIPLALLTLPYDREEPPR